MAVIEDEVEPAVLWEQRVKDVEAENRRKTVTTPGFSFSAAGLLFPYHLGVAQFLIGNGYIKVRRMLRMTKPNQLNQKHSSDSLNISVAVGSIVKLTVSFLAWSPYIYFTNRCEMAQSFEASSRDDI